MSKEKVILHYAKKELDDNILKLEFEDKFSFLSYVYDTLKEGAVYLFTYDTENSASEIIVSANIEAMNNFIMSTIRIIDKRNPLVFYIQEYDSFEEAYKVALHMQEPSELCYSK